MRKCGLPKGGNSQTADAQQGTSTTPPHELIPDRVEHTLGLHSAPSTPLSALDKRLGLGLAAPSVTTRETRYPAVPPGISGDRHCALRIQREEISPDRGEIGVR